MSTWTAGWVHVRRSLQWVKFPRRAAGPLERNGGPDTRLAPRPPDDREHLPCAGSAYRAPTGGCSQSKGVEGSWLPLYERERRAPTRAECQRGLSRVVWSSEGAGDPFSRHTPWLRHAAQYLQGADPFIIQTVFGHSQLSTTRRYTHVPVEVTKAAVTGLEEIFETARQKQKADQQQQQSPAEAIATVQVQ